MVSASITQNRRPSIAKVAGAASTARSFGSAKQNAGSAEIANATNPTMTRMPTVSLVGAALSDETVRRLSSRPQRRIARKGAASATIPEKKRTDIARDRVGAASRDGKENNSFKLPRLIAKPKAAGVSTPKKKRPSMIVRRVGAVSTEKSSQAHEKNVRERAVNGLRHNKKRTRIASCVGVASKDPQAKSSFK